MATGNEAERQERTAWLKGLLAAHERPLARYAARLLGGDPERARDIVQETFLRLWRQDREALAGREVEWLYTVCRNRTVDVRRKEGRMMVVEEPRHPGTAAEAALAPPSQLELVAQRETGGRVLAALEALPERQQEIVRLRFQAGLSYREISRVTGQSVTNVGYLLHTAISQLRARVARLEAPATPTATATARRAR